MLTSSIDQTIVNAIKRAAQDAAEKGVTVKVEMHERGFFSSERIDIEITVEPPKKGI